MHDKILSVVGFNNEEWDWIFWYINEFISPLAVEMNISCPNTPGEDKSSLLHAFRSANKLRARQIPVIVKLPPINYRHIINLAFDMGMTRFHCCNTLPTPGGGLSGKPLKPLSLMCIDELIEMSCQANARVDQIIGGGGITSYDDALEYLSHGATHVSVASVLFNPFKWKEIRNIAAMLALRDLKGVR